MFINKTGFLEQEYDLRFNHQVEYRNKVWKILVANFFQKLIPNEAVVLDVGSGYGEFINNIKANKKYAMDLNSSSKSHLNDDIIFLNQDCAKTWNIPDESIDSIFSSNFLEHLPSKMHVQEVICQAHRCLKKNGVLILLNPNIKYTGHEYWDFWDHHIPLTEKSVGELLSIYNFQITKCLHKFLPYSMSNRKQIPLILVKMYLKIPLFWKIFGKQFLIIAKK